MHRSRRREPSVVPELCRFGGASADVEHFVSGKQFLRITIKRDATVMHDEQTIREVDHCVGIIAGDNHCGTGQRKFAQHLLYLRCACVVERREWFVEKPGARTGGKECCEKHSLRLATRE